MKRRLIFLCLTALLMIVPLRAQEEETIPDPVPLIDEGGQDILNIMLIGSATENDYNPGLTDTLMIVSINQAAGSVSLVSIPRDLYVYIPDFGMHKINTAYLFGETKQDGRGIELLKETLLYNLGVEVDHYARINFTGFKRIIDSVGGIQITVDCIIRDWKLISPELDKQNPDNWEMYTLPMGVHTIDSEVALWYVRSRRTSSDLDRGRRQQDVLRALWRKIRAEGLLEHLPELWQDIDEIVETDLTLADVLNLTPLALTTDTSSINYFVFRQKKQVRNALSADGQEVLMPIPDGVAELMQQFMTPPTTSQLQTGRPTLGIINASGVPGLGRVAADRLELEGFQTMLLDEWSPPREYNHIIDYTGDTKSGRLSRIQSVMRVTDEGVRIEPDPAREVDYRVYIGNQYQFLVCTRDVIQPVIEVTPEPVAEQ